MRYLLFLFTLFISLTLSAQNVRTTSTEYDKLTLDAVSVPIDAEMKVVEDHLDEFFDERYDIDIDRTDKDRGSIAYGAEQVVLPLVSPKAVNLYAKVAEAGDRASTVYLSFAFTPNDVVNERAHPESFRAGQSILEEFRTYFYDKYFGEQLEEAREELEDMRDDSSDDSKDAQKARKKIDKYERRIANFERKIEELRQEVGDELESAEEKAERARAIERRIRDLEAQRSRYLRR